jgi:hypothetical protein
MTSRGGRANYASAILTWFLQPLDEALPPARAKFNIWRFDLSAPRTHVRLETAGASLAWSGP